MEDWLRRLPKVDLHLHLDGSVKPDTWLALASDQGIPSPVRDAASLLPLMRVDDTCGSLPDYLDKFAFVLPLLQTGEALERVAREAVEQASAHNCLYVEVRFAPQLHTQRGLTPDDAIRAVIAGLREGERRTGVVARVIAICMRHHSEALNHPVVEAAVRHYGRGLVAVDLAGDEGAFPAERFRDVFALAREAGIPITIHAGEAAGPFNIREAVEGLGAARIGHGVRLREDAELLEWIRERRIPLELCPTSNIQTKAVSSWSDFPLRDYYDRGLAVTVNTDNPTVSGTDMTRECRELAERFGFTAAELAGMMRNALDAAFVEEPARARLYARFEAQLAEMGIAL
ncbi:adenosine deaminase [Cohnella nanjingensis]|uniref:adenosine deaminase n=1 Tax=Cohnella nanjingensis TaxID=1387779 RepID=A0A7X0RVZ2_9BACL|nr:adenosine deaminase [Cohnella nanjingensis]MBB6673365.1 adenosine deaminase [Cohnella nanjingensis]